MSLTTSSDNVSEIYSSLSKRCGNNDCPLVIFFVYTSHRILQKKGNVVIGPINEYMEEAKFVTKKKGRS